MEGIQLTALALLVLFGANWVLYGCLWLHERYSSRTASASEDAKQLPDASASGSAAAVPAGGGDASAAAPVAAAGGGHGKKVLSEPLSRTLTSVRAFSWELSRLGVLITFAYMCEHHPPFAHGEKAHDMDMFWCVALMLLVSSALNVRKSKGGDVLNREQTEEWKGWMQFMFLMYHYFSAHEVYNSIRVFITAYVWMTGFGNFSFFYLKGDYGAVRLLQMLWRLNFLVILLCMAMGNTYILYYICPLHTFYFFVVYAIMSPAKSANYTKNGMRWKLLVAGSIIFCVWDWDLHIFEKIFFFLGREKVVGAGNGTMWEWYFRTSLDHWSTFLGMIFALNYPATAQWVKKIESLPFGRQWAIKGSVAAVLLSATAWWAANILPLEKLVYNQKNAYFGVAIPVLTYIYVRNLTPLMRTRYLEPLHSLGKITLETYLMQHHIWLTSNAKTLLVVVPGSPKLNMVIVTVCYVLVSRELYRLTMSLRGMCLPDELSACLRNLAGIACTVAACVAVAKALLVAGAGPAACACIIGAIGFGLVFAVHKLLLDAGSGGGGGDLSIGNGVGSGEEVSASASRPASYDGKLLNACNVLPVVATLLAFACGSAVVSSSQSSTRVDPWHYSYSTDVCVETVNHGMWKVEAGQCQEPGEATAYCNSHQWKWVDVPDQCHVHYMPPSEVEEALKGRNVVVVGDSVNRFVYWALVRSLGEATPMAHDTTIEKHSDFSWQASDDWGTRFSFLWAPEVEDLNERVAEALDMSGVDIVLIGGGLWDALNGEGDLEGYRSGISSVHNKVIARTPSDKGVVPAVMWVSMTKVINERLLDDKKREWLTEPKLAAYRGIVESSGIFHDVDGVIDGVKLTTGQRMESYDGVHYSDLTYDAFAQVAVNLVTHLERTGTIGAVDSPPPAAGDTKDIWGMGSKALGVIVLLLASVMVLTRDAFHGTVRLAIAVTSFGRPPFDAESMSWEATYGNLLRKIGKHPDGGSQLSAPSAIGGTKAAAAAAAAGGSSSGGGSGNGGRRLRERGRSANRDDEEATRSLLGDGVDGGGGSGGRGVLEMTSTGNHAA
ncbi:conserved unknown protein [Ectocarpus siliculosus]|uniref:Cas1p 10 TM acyl transferase domain-containing protein n=1 Tax=Ectocarpus siliculosus TaxID=2880 RepID=D8LDR2_ECTSI|nr:conserved unknown protein [Ectocarpus siliculosus]|eukprot:CBN78469.1 conserved unknown protein [Ectocarpus siliculosus]